MDVHEKLDQIDEQVEVTAEEYEAGWFATMPVEDEPMPLAGFCNMCRHPIRRQGYNFLCTEGCKCLMLGCVQRLEDRA